MSRIKIWTAALGAAFLAGGFAGWWVLFRDDGREAQIRRLQEVIDRLQSERRIAEVVVLKQDEARTKTTFRFREVRPDGTPIHERDLTIDGDVAYFDALVIKFDHRYVERGDLLRGRSLYLFQRIFGEHQEPAQGFRIDEEVPAPYRLRPIPSEFERELWSEFWTYALEPERARAKGIRVVQGEAVRTKLRPDRIYRLTIEAAGGINIAVEKLPGALH